MNENIAKGKWSEIKGEIQKTWGELTGDELDRTKGNVSSLAGIIRQKFGLAQDDAESKLNEIMGRYKSDAKTTYDTEKESLADKTNSKIEGFKDSLKK